MFPQLIETMYSPALTSIKNHFSVTTSEAAQALSLFFMVFAVGVVFHEMLTGQKVVRPGDPTRSWRTFATTI